MLANLFLLAEVPVKEKLSLEQWSYIATIVMAGVAILALGAIGVAMFQAWTARKQNEIALGQLKLMGEQLQASRAEVILRSQRESIAVALDQCRRFAEDIVPVFDELYKRMLALGFRPPASVNPDFPLIQKEPDPRAVKLWVEDKPLQMEIIQKLNLLESFAMYFSNDLADESVAFIPTGATFCQLCEFFHYFIGLYRQPEKMKLYCNLVKLYNVWKPRVERTVLEEQAKILDAKKLQLPPDVKGKPLGTVEKRP